MKSLRTALSVVLGILIVMMASAAWAQSSDSLDEILPGRDIVEREPSAVRSSVSKRTYLGGADDDDLSVQKQIPEAAIRVDARSVQREIYKKLYREDMKDDRQETMEE